MVRRARTLNVYPTIDETVPEANVVRSRRNGWLLERYTSFPCPMTMTMSNVSHFRLRLLGHWATGQGSSGTRCHMITRHPNLQTVLEGSILCFPRFCKCNEPRASL